MTQEMADIPPLGGQFYGDKAKYTKMHQDKPW